MIKLFEHHERHTTPTGISVSLKRDGVPKFEREYRAKISDHVDITITMRTYWAGHRSGRGELTQTGGRYVLFDPENVADKILDPIILPAVEERCREIINMDCEFMRADPSEFTDESGHVWKRSAQ